MPDAKPLQYRIIDLAGADEGADDRDEVIAGLLDSPARIAPKFFYDDLGCALYGAICRLPEYYPTRTEIGIFQAFRAEIADEVGQGMQLVDLGAGDCCKAESWLPFFNPTRYVAVDIAGAEIHRSLARLAPEFPEIELLGVLCDFSRGLELDAVLDRRATVFFYPGSSIGNFTPAEAVTFLGSIQRHCAARPGSGLLIGVDGKKSKAVLDAAYDDPLGVTAAFNRNALLHLNRRFGFDFALDGFTHRGFYNEALGRIEMHLEAVRDQVVRVGTASRRFARGERIHTENSYKYHAAEFEQMLHAARFADVSCWTNADRGYFVFYAK